MIDEYAVTDALIPVLRPLLEPGNSSYQLRVIPTDLDKCNDPYSTIQVLNIDPIGMMEYGGVVVDDEENSIGQQVKQDFYVKIRIQSIGEKAGTRTRRLQSRLEYPSVIHSMSSLGYGFISKTEVVDISGPNTTNNERRFTFDFIVSAVDGDFSRTTQTAPEDEGKAGFPVYDENIDYIEKVPIDQTLIPDGSTDESDYVEDQYTIDLNDT